MLSVESESMPPLSLIARPFHRLAGIRVDAASGNRRRTSINNKLSLVRFNDPQPKPLPINLPAARFLTLPSGQLRATISPLKSIPETKLNFG
jgi:hypothetical protein